MLAETRGPLRLSLTFGALLLGCGGGAGDLSTDELNQVVAREQPSLKPCYDAALEKHPYKQELRLNAVIRVAPTGQVASVHLDQEGLPGMGECLQQAISRWRFPQAKAPTDTSLPLIFRPQVEKREP